MRYYLLLFLFSISTFSCSYDMKTESIAIPEDALVLEESIEIEPPRNGSGNWDTGEIDSSSDELLAYNDQSETKKESKQKPPIQKKSRKKIIRQARVNIEVADYETSMKDIRASAQKFAAEISREAEHRNRHRIQNDLEFRLPPERLDDFLIAISDIAEIVTFKEVTANDVTKKYYNLQTRLKAREATILRYQQLLQQANNVTEVLAVERELRDAIEERDVIKGEIKYLNDQVGRSTVHLDLIQNLEYSPHRRSFFKRVGDAFANGWHGFLEFMIGVVSAWPFWILGGILVTLFVRYRRRRKA
ncbi:MAG: DUF4349 domain-containing protein [Saprospiraceae bacterium]